MGKVGLRMIMCALLTSCSAVHKEDELNGYITQSRHCNRDAEMTIKQVIPGLTPVPIQIRLGRNPVTYEKCMEAAGYEQKEPPKPASR